MTTQKYKTDVVIIGAGPVGLFAVFECGMLQMKCHVIDALPEIGGQCMALYPEKPIYDIPAWPRINGGDLIEQLYDQARPFKPMYHLNQQAANVERLEDGSFEVTTSLNEVIACKAIIIAAGAGAFGPNKPPMENLAAFENKSVFYMVRRCEDFVGKKIAIAGGGDSAVDWALSLAPHAEKIYFIHRRPKFRAAPESVAKLEKLAQSGKIEMIVPYQLTRLDGTDGQVENLTVSDLDGNQKVLEIDALLPFFGLAAKLGPIAEWGLNLDHTHIETDPTTAQTSQEGIYAIGDIATYDNKLKLILTGFSEAAMAAHHAYGIVNNGKALHIEYSTSIGLPQENQKAS